MPATHHVSLMEAWQAWGDGSLQSTWYLFGLTIVWWGRIGKLLQFLAALTIVAEILGAQRLRAFGKSLHHFLSARDIRRIGTHSVTWVLALFSVLTGPRVAGHGRFLRSSPLSRFILVIAFAILAIVTARFAQYTDSWIIGLLGATVFMVIGGIFFAPVIAFVLLGSLALLGAAFDGLIVEPVAWVLERDTLDRWVKISSLALLLVGFHFDMLSS